MDAAGRRSAHEIVRAGKRPDQLTTCARARLLSRKANGANGMVGGEAGLKGGKWNSFGARKKGLLSELWYQLFPVPLMVSSPLMRSECNGARAHGTEKGVSIHGGTLRSVLFAHHVLPRCASLTSPPTLGRALPTPVRPLTRGSPPAVARVVPLCIAAPSLLTVYAIDAYGGSMRAMGESLLSDPVEFAAKCWSWCNPWQGNAAAWHIPLIFIALQWVLFLIAPGHQTRVSEGRQRRERPTCLQRASLFSMLWRG